MHGRNQPYPLRVEFYPTHHQTSSRGPCVMSKQDAPLFLMIPDDIWRSRVALSASTYAERNIQIEPHSVAFFLLW